CTLLPYTTLFRSRFDQLGRHVLREAAHVVVRLDRGRRASHRGRLDDVRVDRALHEEARLGAGFASRLLEDTDEGLADPPPLLLRVLDPLQALEEPLARIHDHQPDPEMAPEGALHALALALPEQPGVDEDAGELVADGPVHECGGDRRIDAAGQPADHLLVADLPTVPLDRLLY